MLLGQVSPAASERITLIQLSRQNFVDTAVGSRGMSVHLLGPGTLSSQKSKRQNISTRNQISPSLLERKQDW